ncbi:putative FBD-associated F-box protein [Senna tora]|uniref:Putative FBD-associated F-box protein n=1 Tax=Senna tora TaxID=362788 RepID=A0A834SJF6_9FABA|nr:putative FBD-associated F-box protein [Senna tora]
MDPNKRIKDGDDAPPPLSHLHEDIIENIFTFLPITESIRVGTTSTRYKKSWCLNRKLLFGREFEFRYPQQELVALIQRVFDSNIAPEIQAFCLYIDPDGVQPTIEKWLQICVSKQIQELELKFHGQFCLASRFVDIQTLRVLVLIHCEIQLPRVLTGLQFLNKLVLRQMEMTEQKIEALVAQCKLLGTLDLSECWKIRVLRVTHKRLTTLKIACLPDVAGIHMDVPNLRALFFCGFVMTIQFATKPLHLKEAFANFLPSRVYMEPSKIEHLAIDFSNVTVLTTSSIFLEVYMAGGSFCNPYDIATFLNSCPHMEVLFMDLNDYNYEFGMFWKLYHQPLFESFPYNLTSLKCVKLAGFQFQEYEVEVVKMILRKAVNLKALIFTTPKNNPSSIASSEGRCGERKGFIFLL